MSVSNYGSVEPQDQCLMYYKYFKSRPSVHDIKRKLANRYVVDDKPVCDEYSICFNVSNVDDSSKDSTLKPIVNKGNIILILKQY